MDLGLVCTVRNICVRLICCRNRPSAGSLACQWWRCKVRFTAPEDFLRIENRIALAIAVTDHWKCIVNMCIYIVEFRSHALVDVNARMIHTDCKEFKMFS